MDPRSIKYLDEVFHAAQSYWKSKNASSSTLPQAPPIGSASSSTLPQAPPIGLASSSTLPQAPPIDSQAQLKEKLSALTTRDLSKTTLTTTVSSSTLPQAPPIDFQAQLKEKLSALTTRDLSKTTLYKISTQKVSLLEKELNPTIIGLGIFHSKLDSSFQITKIHYLNDFLNRHKRSVGNPTTPVENIVPIYWKKLETMTSPIRDFYYPRPIITNGELIEIMLLDGAFIVELFMKYEEYLSEGRYDHTFNKLIPKHIMETIRRDLLKYENQIPFAVIKQLWVIQHGDDNDSLNKLKQYCFNFFEIKIPTNLDQAAFQYNPDHLLALYYFTCVSQTSHQGVVRTLRRAELQVQNKQKLQRVAPASNLKEYGVMFTKNLREDRFSVEFLKSKLELPYLRMDDKQRCLFANFVTYEMNGGQRPISALCFLLNSLMRKEDDVNVLAKKGIIDNTSGNDKDVVEFFSNLCTDLEINSQNEYLTGVITSINEHYQSKLKRGWGGFLGEYFKWPWSYGILSVGVGSAVMNIT